jgi:YD repeat-containing protein
VSRSYTYDRDGNRVGKVETLDGTLKSWTYAFDRTDQLIEQVSGASTTALVYDAFGNLLRKADNDGTETGDHLRARPVRPPQEQRPHSLASGEPRPADGGDGG